MNHLDPPNLPSGDAGSGNDDAFGFGRALENEVRLVQENAMTAALGDALGRAGYAICLLASDCRIAFANGLAQALIAEGTSLRVTDGRLTACEPVALARLRSLVRKASLRSLVRKASAVDGRRDPAEDAIHFERGAGQEPLRAYLIPLRLERATAFVAVERPVAAMFVIDMYRRIKSFSDRFELTAAERRFFSEFIRGTSILAAASKLGISEPTARTHAKRIFAKTATARQTELIRLFFETTLPVGY